MRASPGAGDDVSRPGVADAGGDVPSRSCRGDTSPGDDRDVADASRRCLWCRGGLTATQDKWCSKRCRQTAWRSRRIAVVEDLGDTPKRLAYADPPYPGMSRKYYRDEPTYAGEVDHGRLLLELATYDGWALSTSEKALRDLLPLCPPGVRVCPWVKPNGVSRKARGPFNTWEPLIVMPARLRRPAFRDWLRAKPARGGGKLPGRKPIAFCAWLFQLLGAGPRDTFADLFPGSGIVSRCWREHVRMAKTACIKLEESRT